MMLTDEEMDALWSDITLPQKVARREILRKGIEANNVKVLANLKPVQERIAVKMYGYAIFAEIAAAENLYSADQVAALIQHNAELEARTRGLERGDTQESTCPNCPNFMTGCPGGCKILIHHNEELKVRVKSRQAFEKLMKATS